MADSGVLTAKPHSSIQTVQSKPAYVTWPCRRHVVLCPAASPRASERITGHSYKALPKVTRAPEVGLCEMNNPLVRAGRSAGRRAPDNRRERLRHAGTLLSSRSSVSRSITRDAIASISKDRDGGRAGLGASQVDSGDSAAVNTSTRASTASSVLLRRSMFSMAWRTVVWWRPL